MLENEMNRAKKKIDETRKKTLEIRQLKFNNDQKVLKNLSLQRIQEEKSGPNTELLLRRQVEKE